MIDDRGTQPAYHLVRIAICTPDHGPGRLPVESKYRHRRFSGHALYAPIVAGDAGTSSRGLSAPATASPCGASRHQSALTGSPADTALLPYRMGFPVRKPRLHKGSDNLATGA